MEFNFFVCESQEEEEEKKKNSKEEEEEKKKKKRKERKEKEKNEKNHPTTQLKQLSNQASHQSSHQSSQPPIKPKANKVDTGSGEAFFAFFSKIFPPTDGEGDVSQTSPYLPSPLEIPQELHGEEKPGEQASQGEGDNGDYEHSGLELV